MPCNGQCVPVRSRWVRQFILTANCELAVWFKNGVCCLYPHTTAAWFKRAIAAPSPGRYIWQYLYKKMPYRLIRPPCPPSGGGGITTTCCPAAALPQTLHATVAGGGGVAGSYAMVYAGGPWAYTGALGSCSASPATLVFACTAASWTLQVSGNPTVYSPSSTVCSPLQVTFNDVNLTSCGGGAGAVLTVTL
jgi:hypothetical protein